MTNEQTIDEIMGAVLASQDSAFRRGDGLEGYEESVAADQHVRDLITAALAAKDAEIAECDALRADMAAILRAVAIAVRGPEVDGISWGWADLPDRATAAMNMMSGAVELAREQAAEIERLNRAYHQQREDAQSRVDAAVLRALAAEREAERLQAQLTEPAKPEPGEWIEWKGGDVAPMSDDVLVTIKCRDGCIQHDHIPSNVDWDHSSITDYWGDVIAYRVQA